MTGSDGNKFSTHEELMMLPLQFNKLMIMWKCDYDFSTNCIVGSHNWNEHTKDWLNKDKNIKNVAIILQASLLLTFTINLSIRV